LFNESVVVVEETWQHVEHHDTGGDELVILGFTDVIFCVSSRQEDTFYLVISHLVGGLVSCYQELSRFQGYLCSGECF
jgi:hypothetical protein